MTPPLVLAPPSPALCVPVPFAEPTPGPLASATAAGGAPTGWTCVKIPAGSTSVTPAVTDSIFGSEGGIIQFVVGPCQPAGITFCPGDAFSIPAGATKVIVSVTDPATNFQTCGIAGAGTSGTVSATFS